VLFVVLGLLAQCLLISVAAENVCYGLANGNKEANIIFMTLCRHNIQLTTHSYACKLSNCTPQP